MPRSWSLAAAKNGALSLATAGALGGGVLIVVESLWQTSIQRHVPEHLLSRASWPSPGLSPRLPGRG